MLKPGDLVAGKYRVERLLGEGGMGAVFVAVNEKLKKRVALKILRREASSAHGAAERFTREAIAASSAKHPGVIEIYDADVHEGMPWIAMELLEGESLAARMARGPIRVDEVLEIVSQALAALAHVHRAGIIHRDLKPDNLFLEALPEGGRRVKILDFGIAASSGPELMRVTQTGMAIGTPAYLAPEQAAGERDLDARVDVYAIGVILFELVTGHLPYRAASIGEMVRRMYTEGPPPLAREAPHVDPRLAALVDTCLAIDRELRVRNADALRRELDALRASAPVTHATPVSSSMSPRAHVHTPEAYEATMHAPATPPAVLGVAPPKRSNGLLAIGIGVAFVVALALGGALALVLFFSMRPSEPVVTRVVESPPLAQPIEMPAGVVEPVPVLTIVPDASVASNGRSNEEPDAGANGSVAGLRSTGRARRAPPAQHAAPVEPPPVAAPDVPRPLDDAVFRRVLIAHESELDACYFAAYPELPRPRVPVELDVTVSTNGSVSDADAAGGRPGLAPCLTRVLYRMRFPPHPYSSHVHSAITLYDGA